MLLSALLLLLATAANGLNALVYGPGSLELKLLTAKYVARDGGDASVYAGDDKRTQKQWRKLLYGGEYAEKDVDAPGCARVLTTTE